MNNLKNMQYGNEIIIYFNNIKSEIELYNGFKLYNINKFAEYFYAEFLNLLFGYELEIMEQVNPNMVAIDLGDTNGEIAIQITSDISRRKIKETIEKYNKNALNTVYKKLVVLHIANETPNYNKPHTIEQFNLKEDVWNIEYLLSKMPIENIEKLKNIRDFLKKYVEDSPQISNLDNFLKERYKNQNFTKLKPLSSLNTNVYIQDIYQDLSIIKKIKSKDNEGNDRTISTEITIDKILDDFQKVAILGKSGIGKSTLSKYICYQWANGQLFDNYEYLFYIPIKKWEKGEGIFDVVLKILKESNNENIKVEADDLYEYIKNFNNITLFVIDGLDEIRKEEQEDIKKEIQNFNNYIITSRHEGLNNSKLNIEETFYNEGFNQKSIENFIKYIRNSNGLLKQINSYNQLKELSKIPMLLDMICYLYKENQIDFNGHFTMTALYEKFLDEIILRFEEERESQSSKVTKEDDDIFFELGKIAFDNLKNKKFKFKGTFITRSNRKFIENELLPFGFIVNLTNERHLKDREYEFIHTSFQEYFSALYVSTLSQEEQSEKIQESKFHPHMQMFFAFLGGLIEDKEFLLGAIESEPRDISLSYTLEKIFICINEFKNKDIFLLDFNKRIILLNEKKLINEWTIFKIGCNNNPSSLISLHWIYYAEVNGKFISKSKEANESFFDLMNKYFAEEENFEILKKDNEGIIDLLLSLLPRGFKGLDEEICDYLLSLNNHSEKIIIGIINFIEECITDGTRKRTLKKVLQLINQDFTFFQQVYKIIKDTNLNYNLYRLNIKTLFCAFDEDYEIIDYIVLHCKYNIKPLYLKNKKLHTIENGKEISTQREVDEATLNEIKMLLKGD